MIARHVHAGVLPVLVTLGCVGGRTPKDTADTDSGVVAPSGDTARTTPPPTLPTTPTTPTTADTASTASTGETGVATDCPGGVFEGHTTVDAAAVACYVTDGELTATLTGLSEPGSAVIFMQETGSSYVGGQWSEEHPLDTASFDPCGWTESLVQDVVLGASVYGWIPGESSVFQCANHLELPGWMTFAVYVVDADDPNVTSCLSWGDDPAGLAAGDYDDERVGVSPSFDLSACAF